MKDFEWVNLGEEIILNERQMKDNERNAIKNMVDKMKDSPRASKAFQNKFGKDWVSAMFGVSTNIVKKRSNSGNEPDEPLTKTKS